mmetsp:Transcript_14859/g.29312  ORF Transcript_14859/g.29312 Transcript_14859/m.29312 type:complete len:306 (+) Transcript_14859:45-962(+)|eukprot:CAMPEP_0172670286 /NCGR_PEP_ID=MMETSP1074-20121228/10208_1 /TAXON_ID=2916 /ORGANISM="Ceratium fusus, Strain PA161109" /LENGTH=305 /DNA_ID=CAMNT_0013487175 /DNA_START=36 /DNA_END=953 /DNA_ORIENTATION=+
MTAQPSTSDAMETESVQKTNTKESEDLSPTKHTPRSLPAVLPTPCRGGRRRTPLLHYMPVNKVRFDLSDGNGFSTTETASGRAADFKIKTLWGLGDKPRFYASVVAALAAGALLLVGIMFIFDYGHHALHEKLAARPISANVRGLITPGPSQTTGRGDISGVLGSATSVSSFRMGSAKADSKKTFDFRPTFSGHRSSGKSVVKADNEKTHDVQPRYDGQLRRGRNADKVVDPKSSDNGQNSNEESLAIVTDELPGPIESGRSNWLHQSHAFVAAEDSSPAVAADEATTVSALGTHALHGVPSVGV